MFGIYEVFTPYLFACDPEIVRDVLVKEFDYFSERRNFKFAEEINFLNEMVSIVNGSKWKRLRSTMSPTFSSGKLKIMFPLVQKQAKNFLSFCEKEYDSKKSIDMKDAFGRYTMDVIASTAFAIDSNSLKNGNSVFVQKVGKVFDTSLVANVMMTLFLVAPKIASVFGKFFSLLNVENPWVFLKEVATETIKARRKTDSGKHGDFLDLMLEEQSKQKDKFDPERDYEITDATIMAECALFLVAGYDTTANTLSFSGYHLARNTECLNILREELSDIRNEDGSFDYHNLMEAKYLDACINEALRLNPPGPVLERKCTKSFNIKGTNFNIPENMMVGIPIWGIHRDPDYWVDPESFNPERFLPENKDNIVPFSYMPFGLGPRNCLAMRFALMEVKICLAELVMNYDFQLKAGHEEVLLCNGGGIVKPRENSLLFEIKRIAN